MPRERRKESLRLAVVIVLCAGAASAGAQTYVGNNFASGSSLLAALQTDGNSDQYPPLVILQEYSPSGPATSGAIFDSTGTVNDVTFYGGGNYDFTVYALALANTTKNELTFSVVGDETFKGDATTTGVQNLAANFSVGAGDYLAFAGVGPWYPQEPNNAVGSDATYASSSEPQTYPTSFTAIPPTTGQTFTVGAHGDAGATYEIVPDPFENQGRSYAIGVTYTPSVVSQQFFLNSASLGRTNLSWSNQNSQSNWVNSTGALTGPPQTGKDVFVTNQTGMNANGPTVMTFDAATDPNINGLTIDSNAGGQLVELAQSANTLTTGSETLGATGPAEHLQTGGVNNVTGALTVEGFGVYDLQGGALKAGTIEVNSGGSFYFDGGTANYTTFNLSGGVVASGTATWLASASASNMGTGAEVVSAPGSLTAPSAPGALPRVSGGATFNQSGMVTFNQLGEAVAGSGSLNDAGALTLGLNGGVGVYNFSGGVLNAVSETIGGDIASFGLFNQTAGLNTVSGALTVGGGSYFALSGGTSFAQSNYSELSAGSVQVDSGGSFGQSGGSAAIGALSVANGGSYALSGGGLRGQTETVAGSFTQSGGGNGGGLLTIENGGVYDLRGGTLSINTTIGAAGQLVFDGGAIGNRALNAQSITLNSGGSVTSNGNELIDNSAIFTQTGGTNTTANLTVVSPTSTNAYGAYDLQGGVLNAGTISVNAVNTSLVGGSGYFYFDGGTANYTTFNLNGGVVASGAPGSLASAGFAGSGNETVSGATFNQTGGSNTTEGLVIAGTHEHERRVRPLFDGKIRSQKWHSDRLDHQC